jgi:hypothetical protein
MIPEIIQVPSRPVRRVGAKWVECANPVQYGIFIPCGAPLVTFCFPAIVRGSPRQQFSFLD